MKHIKEMKHMKDINISDEFLGNNYLRPMELETEDKPEDWLTFSLVMSAALDLILKEDEGIVVKLKGDMLKLLPGTKNVVVHKSNGMVRITKSDEIDSLPNGQFVWLDKDEE